MAEFLSNGYIRFGAPISATYRCATEVSFKANANSEDVITLTGDVGSSEGFQMGTINVTGVVAKSENDRKKIVEAFEDNKTVSCYYKSGNAVFVVTGTIKDFENSDKVNSPTSFNFSMSGKKERAQT